MKFYLSSNLDYKRWREIREIMTFVRDGGTTASPRSDDPLVQKIRTLTINDFEGFLFIWDWEAVEPG